MSQSDNQSLLTGRLRKLKEDQDELGRLEQTQERLTQDSITVEIRNDGLVTVRLDNAIRESLTFWMTNVEASALALREAMVQDVAERIAAIRDRWAP